MEQVRTKNLVPKQDELTDILKSISEHNNIRLHKCQVRKIMEEVK